MKRYIFIFILCLFGCNSKNDKVNYKNRFRQWPQLEIPKEFEIVKNIETYSFGNDYTESFTLRFSKKDFNNIYDRLKPTRIKNIDSTLYGYSVEKGNERISAILNPNQNTIKYTYNRE